MKLYKQGTTAYVDYNEERYIFTNIDWDNFTNRKGLRAAIVKDIENNQYEEVITIGDLGFTPDAPIGSQEIWASGVTYLRSKEARMEESKKKWRRYIFMIKVYDADRPELFLKHLQIEW